MGITQHDLLRGVPCVLVGSTVRRSVLKILGIGCIKPAAKAMTREVRVKTDGKVREDQVGGIEDPEAAAPPAQRVGRVTRVPREKKVKWAPMVKARDLSCKLQGHTAWHLTMSSTAAL